jgi:predicted protein tyrosine phosphatase
MPRQPFLKHPEIRRNIDRGSKWSIGSEFRMQRPEHISKIGECLTTWPDVDAQLALLLAALTKSDAVPMIAVYSVIRRATGRYEAIKAAAKVCVNKTGQALIAAILSFVETVEQERNDLAHGHWGISRFLPKEILWVDGNYINEFAVRHRQRTTREKPYSRVEAVPDAVFYYRIKDFDIILRDIKHVCEAVYLFRSSLDMYEWDDVFSPNALLCARLESYAPIRQALTRINGYVLQPTQPKQPRRRKEPAT